MEPEARSWRLGGHLYSMVSLGLNSSVIRWLVERKAVPTSGGNMTRSYAREANNRSSRVVVVEEGDLGEVVVSHRQQGPGPGLALSKCLQTGLPHPESVGGHQTILGNLMNPVTWSPGHPPR